MDHRRVHAHADADARADRRLTCRRAGPRAARSTRPPQRCKMGYGYYPASNQVVPSLRLRGRWLEQLGFAIGSSLRIEVRAGELVVRVAPAE